LPATIDQAPKSQVYVYPGEWFGFWIRGFMAKTASKYLSHQQSIYVGILTVNIA
jgi:hypothetical protein